MYHNQVCCETCLIGFAHERIIVSYVLNILVHYVAWPKVIRLEQLFDSITKKIEMKLTIGQ